jgi:hypothetical protein
VNVEDQPGRRGLPMVMTLSVTNTVVVLVGVGLMKSVEMLVLRVVMMSRAVVCLGRFS